MKDLLLLRVGFFASICLCFVCSMTSAQTHPGPSAVQKEGVMATHATGTFEVKLTPLETHEKDSTLGRMSIDKLFHGDLEGTSKGEMLTGMTSVKGSAGYVAIEKVSGSLHGKRGSFIFQHTGTMTRGAPQLSITVVPDSGTGELVGLAGKMTIKIAEGKHSYEFEYSLLEAAPH